MNALVEKDDSKAVTAFSRALFLVDAPHFVSSYRGSKAEGRPIHFEQAGAQVDGATRAALGSDTIKIETICINELVYRQTHAVHQPPEPANSAILLYSERSVRLH